ncbi:MAG: hypothetical protein IT440_02960 [Phycisphaeraceae bacterium]|nr:hypothetical protein [Phycisphaeraceae bacterium]
MTQAPGNLSGSVPTRKPRPDIYCVLTCVALVALLAAILFTMIRGSQIFGGVGEMFNLPKPQARTQARSVPAKPSAPAAATEAPAATDNTSGEAAPSAEPAAGANP